MENSSWTSVRLQSNPYTNSAYCSCQCGPEAYITHLDGSELVNYYNENESKGARLIRIVAI